MHFRGNQTRVLFSDIMPCRCPDIVKKTAGLGHPAAMPIARWRETVDSRRIETGQTRDGRLGCIGRRIPMSDHVWGMGVLADG